MIAAETSSDLATAGERFPRMARWIFASFTCHLHFYRTSFSCGVMSSHRFQSGHECCDSSASITFRVGAMSLPLRIYPGILFALIAVGAHAGGERVIKCDATHSLLCEGDRCERTPDEYAHVDLLLDLGSGGGNLCTFTYCRPVTWLTVLGDRSKIRTFGPILSAASGSTEDKLDDPVVDYYLWISEDRAMFSLLPLRGDGAAWSGACAAIAGAG